MFGSISSLFADDQRIYVVDGQVPVVRAYGLDGSFIGDISRQGEGPGEYGSPALLTVHPSGRLFIYDSPNRRINVYTRAGEPLDTWPLNISRCCAWPIFALGPDELWVHIRQRIEDPNDPRDVRFGIQSLGPEGLQGAVTWIPDLEFEPPTASVGMTTFVDAPMVVARFEDDAGTIMVKRYRLVLPGEE
jgi:hypothetical protein